MSYNIEVQVSCDVGKSKPSEVRSLLVGAAVQTLQQQGITPPADLTILLTDDEQIQQFNRDYRGVDSPTDVLSFPAGEPLLELVDLDPYLGDIAVSVPFAERQAAQAGHDLLAELQLLVVHGVLHLLGHDHADAEEKAAMWGAQTAVLSALSLGHITPTESEHD